MVTPVPRPRGVISYPLQSTVSRRALHTVTVLFATTLQIVTGRTDILPFVDNSVVGRYRFAQTPFLTDQSSALGVTLLRDPLTPVFAVSADVGGGSFVDFWVTDLLGVPVNLVNGQGFNFGLIIRDS